MAISSSDYYEIYWHQKHVQEGGTFSVGLLEVPEPIGFETTLLWRIPLNVPASSLKIESDTMVDTIVPEQDLFGLQSKGASWYSKGF